MAPPIYESEEKKDPSMKIKSKMTQDIRVLVEADNDEKIYNLMGLSRDQFLKFYDNYKYMKKHGMNTKVQSEKVKNAEFAKEFFTIMDEDGGGVSALELAYPLIALGLATDIGFVNRVMKMLAPKKFRRDPDSELCMREFSTLFRIEQISDKIV